MRVLLCDDDALLRAILGDQLRDMGHEVELAQDGLQALDILKQKTFDVAILDFLMPKKSGLEVFKELKKWPTRPRVILLSAISPKSLPALTEAQPDAVLEKPVKAKALEKALTS